MKKTLESSVTPNNEEINGKLTMLYKEQVITNTILADILKNREVQKLHEEVQAANERAKSRATWMQVIVGVVALSLAVTAILIDLAVINTDHPVIQFAAKAIGAL
jgi:hypothetical protein